MLGPVGGVKYLSQAPEIRREEAGRVCVVAGREGSGQRNPAATAGREGRTERSVHLVAASKFP